MAKPKSRAELKEYCLRKLGKPVIEINVDDDQVDDRIDEAMSFFEDYHFDGTEERYLIRLSVNVLLFPCTSGKNILFKKEIKTVFYECWIFFFIQLIQILQSYSFFNVFCDYIEFLLCVKTGVR